MIHATKRPPEPDTAEQGPTIWHRFDRLMAQLRPQRELLSLARNWDALCWYGWRPHMYNPHLKRLSVQPDGSNGLMRIEEGMTWTLTNAWPTKLTGPTLSAKGNDFAVEQLDLVHERLDIT